MNKIYCFINSSSPSFIHVVALGDDGKVLAGHSSSTEGWAKHDIGITSDWKHDSYKEHFPDGYELEWVDSKDVKTHEGLQKAIEINNALSKENK